MENTVRVLAPAKVNLLLEVAPRRADGYHDLRSVVLPLDLCDELEMTLGGEAGECDVPIENNLVDKAADIFKRKTGLLSLKTGFRLHKNIPMGAGLGGGSSDAAAALVALNALTGDRVPKSTLIEWSAEVGSDVPALLHGGAVLMEGRGERVSPLPARRGVLPPLVLAMPRGLSVSTREIYENCDSRLTSPGKSVKIISSSLCDGNLEALGAELFNGLETTAFALHSEISSAARALREAGARFVMMSGSGAVVFGFARDEKDAELIAGKLPAELWRSIAKALPDGVMAAHGPLEARVPVRVLVGQPF